MASQASWLVAAVMAIGSVVGCADDTSLPEELNGAFVRLTFESGGFCNDPRGCSSKHTVTASPPEISYQQGTSLVPRMTGTLSQGDLARVVGATAGARFRSMLRGGTDNCENIIDGGVSLEFVTDRWSAADTSAWGCEPGHPYIATYDLIEELRLKVLGAAPTPEPLNPCYFSSADGPVCRQFTTTKECADLGGAWDPKRKCGVDAKQLD